MGMYAAGRRTVCGTVNYLWKLRCNRKQGISVYKDKDPRAQYIKKILLENFQDNPAVQNAVYMEEYIWNKKALAANVDFYGALHIIVGYPYGITNFNAFNRKSEKIEIHLL